MLLPATASPLVCQTLPQAQGHHWHLLPLHISHPEPGTRGRSRAPAPTPAPSSLLGCMAFPMAVGSSLGQAARALASLPKSLRQSKQQHLILPPGVLLFAGEQEGAQGTATASRTAPGGEPDPLMGPELLGGSASSPWLSGQAPSPWWTFPEAAFNRSICRVYPAMLQQLPAALAGSAAIGGGCRSPGASQHRGSRSRGALQG